MIRSPTRLFLCAGLAISLLSSTKIYKFLYFPHSYKTFYLSKPITSFTSQRLRIPLEFSNLGNELQKQPPKAETTFTNITGLNIVAIDLGGTKIASGLIKRNGMLYYHPEEKNTPAKSGRDAVLDAVIDMIITTVRSAGYNLDEIDAISLSFPGIYENGAMKYAYNVALEGVDALGELNDRIEKRFGRKLNIYILNDMEAAAIGEAKSGRFTYMTVSTGVNACRFNRMPGRSLKESILNLELGNSPADYIGDERLEDLTSGLYIGERARKEIKEGRKSLIWDLADGNIDSITAVVVGQAAIQGDSLANEIFRDVGYRLGKAIVRLVDEEYPHRENGVRYDTETFIIGGGVTNVGAPLFNAIEKGIILETKTRGKPELADKIQIMRSTIGPVRAIYGASVFAREMEISRDKEIRDLMDELWTALRKESMNKGEVFRIAKRLETEYGVIVNPIGISGYEVEETSKPSSQNYKYICKGSERILNSSGVFHTKAKLEEFAEFGFLIARRVFDTSRNRFGIEVTIMDRGTEKGAGSYTSDQDMPYSFPRVVVEDLKTSGWYPRSYHFYQDFPEGATRIRTMPEPGYWVSGTKWFPLQGASKLFSIIWGIEAESAAEEASLILHDKARRVSSDAFRVVIQGTESISDSAKAMLLKIYAQAFLDYLEKKYLKSPDQRQIRDIIREDFKELMAFNKPEEISKWFGRITEKLKEILSTGKDAYVGKDIYHRPLLHPSYDGSISIETGDDIPVTMKVTNVHTSFQDEFTSFVRDRTIEILKEIRGPYRTTGVETKVPPLHLLAPIEVRTGI